MAWSPDLYLKFADHRLRPALDLMAQVTLEAPKHIVDLGCGPGNVTAILRQRWPDARIIGVDASPEMLVKARRAVDGVEWVEADVGTWHPGRPIDLVYSNAALHWLPDHARLFPHVLAMVAPRGQLAVQMPRNYHAPGLALINQTALDGPWAARLASVVRSVPVAEPKFYYDLLAPRVRAINLWESEYQQVLEGDNPVADWTRSTWLSPLLAALDDPERSAFEAEYRRRVRAAYPPEADGKTLFPFRRLFMVASV
jgi:trans-aconitate 2-methyltransferase